MIAESNTRIFLANERLKLQNPFTQNFTTYVPQQTGRAGSPTFGALSSVSEGRLNGGISLLSEAELDTWVLFIPFVGDLVLTCGHEPSLSLVEGEVHVRAFKKGELYEIRNPYVEDTIHFFQLRFAFGLSQPFEVVPMEMESYPNCLRPILRSKDLLITLGQYEGRKTGKYVPEKAANGLFVYVMDGTFECEDRLIQEGDGLALRSVNALGFEALSNGAVLLVVEFEIGV